MKYRYQVTVYYTDGTSYTRACHGVGREASDGMLEIRDGEPGLIEEVFNLRYVKRVTIKRGEFS